MDLHDTLRAEINAAEEEAGKSGGEVSAERLASIERLKKLIEIGDDVRDRRSNRWIAVAVVSMGVIVSGILITVRVPAVDIALTATTSFVAFHPTTSLTLFAPALAATSIRASELDSVTISGAPSGRDTSLSVSALAFSRGARGSIGVAAIPIAAHQPVRLGDDDGELTLSTDAKPGGIKLELSGPIDLRGDIQRMMSLRDGSATLWYGTGGVALRTRPVDSTTQRGLTAVARIDTLELFQLSPTAKLPDGLPKPVSAVHEGTINFPSVDSSMIKLGGDTWVELDGVDGEMSAIQITPRGLAMSFHGSVRQAWSVNEQSRRNLKPLLFDYVRARHTVVLVWSAIVWALGTVFAIVRWWRRPSA